MRALAGLAAVLVVAVVVAVARPPITNPALAHELIHMARTASEARQAGLGSDSNVAEIAQRLLQVRDDVDTVQTANLTRLKDIVRDHGWPDRREVGPEGAHAAWSIAASSGDAGFQETVLEMMRRDAKYVDAEDVAFMVDRVEVSKGLPQRYGTQFRCIEGVWTLSPPVAGGRDGLRRLRVAEGLGPPKFRYEVLESLFGPCWPKPTYVVIPGPQPDGS